MNIDLSGFHMIQNLGCDVVQSSFHIQQQNQFVNKAKNQPKTSEPSWIIIPSKNS